ncbi:ribonucleoside-diphosphate reductase beta chain [Catenulispora sp. MAP12-49]
MMSNGATTGTDSGSAQEGMADSDTDSDTDTEGHEHKHEHEHDEAGPPGRDGLPDLPGSADLYNRWEVRQWSVAGLDVARDRRRFAELKPFARREILSALAELEIGESCVTRTLSALVDHAPDEADRLYLCTQLADEARHVRFFQSYLSDVAGIGADQLEPHGTMGGESGFGVVFDPLLRSQTGNVRIRPDDRRVWHVAVVSYHLVAEGLLAVAGLRALRALAKTCELTALSQGLANVVRDEARHVTFGLAATRRGARSGYAEAIGQAYLDGLDAATRVLVNPARRAASPVMPTALGAYAGNLAAQWSAARARMRRHVEVVGLAALEAPAELRWSSGFGVALAEYRERWGAEHPVARARRLGLVRPVTD